MCVPTCEMDTLVSAQGVCEVRQGNASHFHSQIGLSFSPLPLLFPHLSSVAILSWACRVWAKWSWGLCWGQKPCGEGR